MGGDYPDWTDLLQLVGSDIMVPIDIQASYVMLPVDIQAQYATLEIDIVAQTVGNIAIDLAAQSIGNLAVDINAQTIGNLVIDIEAQSIGLYLQTEWAVLQGLDKGDFYSGSQKASGTVVEGTYYVPAGKTLYITAIQTYCGPFNLTVDGEKSHHFWACVYDGANIFDMTFGGEGGSSLNLSKPLRVNGGDYVKFIIKNMTNHDCGLGISWEGYEI